VNAKHCLIPIIPIASIWSLSSNWAPWTMNEKIPNAESQPFPKL
jgi:hypothetical protein